MIKKVTAILMMLLMTTSVSACPLWECQYDVNDYSCGCSGSYNCNDGSYNYNECSEERQPIFCQYCGNEMWCCTCGTYQEIGGYGRGFQESYTCSGTQMDHWANIRDCYGNIIGQVGEGSSVEVCGVDSSNPDRVLIYDYATGTYGSVLSECVYGGYSWDGSGDNGVFNSYQGGICEYEIDGDNTALYGDYNGGCSYIQTGCYDSADYGDCSYINDSGYSNAGCGVGYNAYSPSYYVTYCETVVQRCVTYGFGGGFGCGLRGMC